MERICPVCTFANNPANEACEMCTTDISGVELTRPAGSPEVNEPSIVTEE